MAERTEAHEGENIDQLKAPSVADMKKVAAAWIEAQPLRRQSTGGRFFRGIMESRIVLQFSTDQWDTTTHWDSQTICLVGVVILTQQSRNKLSLVLWVLSLFCPTPMAA